jgi:4,5-dihydroxyphthalate decarboxylase
MSRSGTSGLDPAARSAAEMAGARTDTALSAAIGRYPHTRALHEGRVRPAGFALELADVEPVHRAFRPMVERLAYDVSEMAIATYLLAREHGRPLVGLPVVVFRTFHHGSIVCAAGSSIRGPADLQGRRIGVRSYAQTTGLWVRGILQSEYGVDLASLTWVTQEGSHVAAFQDPPNVVRVDDGRSLGAMLQAGEIDAAIGLSAAERASTRPVIPNAEAAEAAWFERTGIYPINHMVVLRQPVAAAHAELPSRLFEAFVAARGVARQAGVRSVGPEGAPVPPFLAGEPLPYGADALNRAAADAAARLAHEQGLIGRIYTADEIFDAPL